MKNEKKNWREDAKEYGCLAGGIAQIPYDENGKVKKGKFKFVGKFWHIAEGGRTENDPYFKGVLFDMFNNEQGAFTWTKKEFHSYVDAWSELF